MTAYLPIADSEIDPESPGTTTLFTKLRDNPIAISEGSSGAPPVLDIALDEPGNLKLIETKVASASSSIDFTTGIDSTYDHYIFKISNIQPATNATNFNVRVSTDGGSSYPASSQYNYAISSGSASSVGDMRVASDVSNSANRTLHGQVRLFSPSSSVINTMISGDLVLYANTVGYIHELGWGVYATTTAVNAIRFIMSSGNITKGTISLYGVKK